MSTDITELTSISNRKHRATLRLALPSKGRMEDETVALLRECGLTVNKVNPRQYIARIHEISNLEIWFQRSADVVRKVRDGDADLGIVGYDKIAEYRGNEDNVVIIHDALGYGHCYLAVAVPESWAEINTIGDLAGLAAGRNGSRPLRVVSKYPRLSRAFLEQNQITSYHLLHADGAWKRRR